MLSLTVEQIVLDFIQVLNMFCTIRGVCGAAHVRRMSPLHKPESVLLQHCNTPSWRDAPKPEVLLETRENLRDAKVKCDLCAVSAWVLGPSPLL